MNVLELFSGTGSVGKCCENLGWNAISVDLLMDSTHKVDILEFDYKQYPKDHFGIVWASPPCTNYSTLQNCWINRMRKGKLYTKEVQEEEMAADDKLVLRTLEIIEYFNPTYWFIENPASSKMIDRPFMKDIPFYIVDYCMYSDWGYKKPTRIWTNKKDFIPLVCDGSGSCGNMINGKHKNNLGTVHYAEIEGKLKPINTAELRKKYGHLIIKGARKTINQLDKYRIPENLIYSLFLD
tara:strand:+ start:6646 stop:7359 length:714 start_codon:yes stop_codon:yes gene_type:complete